MGLLDFQGTAETVVGLEAVSIGDVALSAVPRGAPLPAFRDVLVLVRIRDYNLWVGSTEAKVRIFRIFALFVDEVLAMAVDSSTRLCKAAVVHSMVLRTILKVFGASILEVARDVRTNNTSSEASGGTPEVTMVSLAVFRRALELVGPPWVSNLDDLFLRSAVLRTEPRLAETLAGSVRGRDVLAFSEATIE